MNFRSSVAGSHKVVRRPELILTDSEAYFLSITLFFLNELVSTTLVCGQRDTEFELGEFGLLQHVGHTAK